MKILTPGVTAAFALCATVAFAGPVTRPSITPVQAELMTDVQAHLAKVGSVVFARVTIEWRGTDCLLRNGAILEAHVISVVPHTKTEKSSQLGLAFTKAQCGEPKMSNFELLLAAVAAPPQNVDLGILSDPLPVITTPGGLQNNLSNFNASQGVNWPLEAGMYQKQTVPPMQIGDVFGIRGLQLSVGAGPGNKSTLLMNKSHDVSLDRHSVLLLVPIRGVFPGVAASPATPQPASAETATTSNSIASRPEVPAPAAPPADDIDQCEPPQCNIALPSGDASDAENPAASFSIRQLGYSPRPQRVMNSFDHDEVLTYLGPRELLVAFNPHGLVPRHTLGRSGSTVRVIRAALVNVVTHQVTHTVDWELPDNGQYLWPLTEGRVLVHVGSELRVYGDGLKIQNRVALDGPLAFVRVTPDGSFIALGVIRERYSPELHAQLSESLNEEPEEDVQVQVLNRNFEPIAKSTTRSGLIAPALLNEGQAALLAQPNMRYRISMLPWDNHAWTFARFSSSCIPGISSIAPDLIFLASCDKQTDEPEFSVLRPNGKLMLKSVPNPNEFGYAAQGSANRETFVVKIVQSSRPVPAGAPFSAADFISEELRVFRAADGKSLLRVVVGSPSSSSDGFALAPDSSQLAVLTRGQIAVYSLPRQ